MLNLHQITTKARRLCIPGSPAWDAALDPANGILWQGKGTAPHMGGLGGQSFGDYLLQISTVSAFVHFFLYLHIIFEI